MLTEMRNGQRQKRARVRKTNRDAMDAVMKKVNPDFVGFGGQPRQSGERRKQRERPAIIRRRRRTAIRAIARNLIRPRSRRCGKKCRRRWKFRRSRRNGTKQQAMQKAVENESYAMITKNLYPRQRATLKNMVGPTFDRSVMGGGGPFGGRSGGGPGGGRRTAPPRKAGRCEDEFRRR